MTMENSLFVWIVLSDETMDDLYIVNIESCAQICMFNYKIDINIYDVNLKVFN